MSREQFKEAIAGDPISASQHINPLVKFANAFARMHPGAYGAGHQSSSFIGQSSIPPFYRSVMEIVDFKINEQDRADSGLYNVWERYYKAPESSNEQGDWETNNDPDYRKFLLDATEFEGLPEDWYRSNQGAAGAAVFPEQKVDAFWHSQRGAFVPVGFPAEAFIGVPTRRVKNNSLGEYRIERMTEGGFVGLFDANGQSVYKIAYNQSGVAHETNLRYVLDLFAGSDTLSAFPYQMEACEAEIPALTCNYCHPATAASWTVHMQGVTQGSSGDCFDADAWNGDFIINLNTPTLPNCIWRSSPVFTNPCADPSDPLFWTRSSGWYEMQVDIHGNALLSMNGAPIGTPGISNVIATWKASDFNCLGPNTFSSPQTYHNAVNVPATVYVTPNE